jgi:hypothetical protein
MCNPSPDERTSNIAELVVLDVFGHLFKPDIVDAVANFESSVPREILKHFNFDHPKVSFTQIPRRFTCFTDLTVQH